MELGNRLQKDINLILGLCSCPQMLHSKSLEQLYCGFTTDSFDDITDTLENASKIAAMEQEQSLVTKSQ